MYGLMNPSEIRPEGWLREQLLIQARGLSGSLHRVWPDVSRSAWIGGDREGWERVPYWLDGFIPMAWLLEDEALKADAERYVTAILDRQQEDGWICPTDDRKGYDVWAVFLIGKVLAVYGEFTGSPRAQDALRRAMRNLYEGMKSGEIGLFNWGKFRWYECMIPLQFLYDREKEPWILELARMLREQGTDVETCEPLWKTPLNRWRLDTHIVNLCMMLKHEAVTAWLLGEKRGDRAEEMWQLLEEYNGTAVGTFTGDECLSGIGNNHGTELCSVVELMYSCELLYAITGESVWADRLEKIAFNALPATFTDDMWAHQYDQMVNQIACQRFEGKSFFRTNGKDAHLFGLEPHFGCCTSNFSQGWPKLAMSAFTRTQAGVCCAVMLPVSLSTAVNGAPVRIRMETEYPFRLACRYVVEADAPTQFELSVRVPAWAKGLRVNGEAQPLSGMLRFDRVWSGRTEILVELDDQPSLADRPFDLKAAQYGPLVFALPIKAEYVKLEYEKNGVERRYPYCDYELVPQESWNYGFAEEALRVLELEGDEVPFSSHNPRIALEARVCPVEWDFADGYNTVADARPRSNEPMGEAKTVRLFPYGAAKLRMTEMPLAKKAE